jgi:CelD/BcsL family acetyltransferase involved in cellulose biosynthesis
VTEARYPDLDATVLAGPPPDALLDQLPELYGSLFSTREWFESFDDWRPAAACVLDSPRHVLVIRDGGDTLTVYNKAFPIAPADAARACRALFRAFPRARRIHLEVMFPPSRLELPKRVLYSTDHMVVDLPGSAEAYDAALGKSTRKNLRLYANRARRAFPDLHTETVTPAADGGAIVDLIVKWKIARFAAQGRTTYWEQRPGEYTNLVDLLRRCGEAQVTSIGGTPVAVVLLFPVGASMCAQEWAHDPEYERFHLGFVSLHEAIHASIARGATSIDLLWGNAPYKERFGATLRRATALSVFPTQAARLHSLGEAREVAVRDLRREGRRMYWDARHAAGRALRRSRRKGDAPTADNA